MFSFRSSLQHDSWLLMTGVPSSMDKTSGIINPSVSTSSYSNRSNSWNWNAHKYSLWCCVAIRCSVQHGSNGGEESFLFVCGFLCNCLRDYISLMDARYKPHTEHNCLLITSWAAGQLQLHGTTLVKFLRAVTPGWTLKARFCDKNIKIGNEHQHLALPISICWLCYVCWQSKEPFHDNF